MSPERPSPAPLEQAPTRSPEVANQTSVVAPPTTPAVPQPAAAPVAPSQPVTDDLPSVAADDDVIEREWVDKAKKIIALTKEDPYERGKAIADLQADYLRKRWGRELGSGS